MHWRTVELEQTAPILVTKKQFLKIATPLICSTLLLPLSQSEFRLRNNEARFNAKKHLLQQHIYLLVQGLPVGLYVLTPKYRNNLDYIRHWRV